MPRRFSAAHRRARDGLPRFVEDEFRAFLRCGFLAGGFARFRCGDCRTERLVAFSCKGRGFCPSCGGRRMAEGAAHLVDHVFPDVPVRQWVLSVPHRIRYLLAWHHDLCLRRLPARHGLDAEGGCGGPVRRGHAVAGGLGGASVQGLAASGASTQRPHRLDARREPDELPPAPHACQARWESVDLHAGVRLPAGHRDRLERLCRYALRPPLADGRATRTVQLTARAEC